MASKTTIAKQPPPGWRFQTGIILFVLGFLSPAFIPLVAATNLPTKWKIGISGLLSIGIPEVLGIVAVTIKPLYQRTISPTLNPEPLMASPSQ